MFYHFEKGFEVYVRLFSNASKFRREVKFLSKVIPSAFSSLLLLIVTLSCEVCLKFILNT